MVDGMWIRWTIVCPGSLPMEVFHHHIDIGLASEARRAEGTPARPRAQWTYLCDVVIWAWPMASWIENTPAPPKAARPQCAIMGAERRLDRRVSNAALR